MMYKQFLNLLFCLSLAAAAYVVECDEIKAEEIEKYSPTCAIQKQIDNFNQVKQTFDNPYEACSSRETLFLVYGRCEDYPDEAVFCSPQQKKNRNCEEFNQPVCGELIDGDYYFCDNEFFFETFKNYCFACQKELVRFYTLGDCKEF
ncbi:hypothetical protein ABPG74_012714 [Tetrahymena malaccensis]